MKRVTEPLAKHTSLKIGGPAEIVIPDSRSELIDILRECQETGRKYRTLGNGSNLLVSDDGVDELVIKVTECCNEIDIEGNTAEVGASVMIPQFVNACIQHDLGGYEYLYSVPGTMGGAIYMNAGRGASHKQTIADYLVSVKVYSNGGIKEIAAEDLGFEHRYSLFHEDSTKMILSAEFELPTQANEEGRKRAQQRMEKVGERERSIPNAGSVFKYGARLPIHKIPPNGLAVGDARFIERNRIGNDGEATCKDVLRLIKLAKLIHRIAPTFDTPQIEWAIWR